MTTGNYLIGLDLGQSVDPAALVVVERQPLAYAVCHARRLPLGTPYPEVVQAVVALVAEPALAGRVELVVDHSGVGRPVVDMLRQAVPCPVVPVTITSGRAVTRSREGGFRVPKSQLVDAVRVLLRGHRLQVAAGLPEAEALLRELRNFRVRITAAANETYGARSGAHDDLVLAAALACWWGQLRAGVPAGKKS